jgi:hypothetical protein
LDINTALKVLSLDPTVKMEIVKSVYRSLAKEWHPDINKSPQAAQKFIQITEAYDHLLLFHKPTPLKVDTTKRENYYRFLDNKITVHDVLLPESMLTFDSTINAMWREVLYKFHFPKGTILPKTILHKVNSNLQLIINLKCDSRASR